MFKLTNEDKIRIQRVLDLLANIPITWDRYTVDDAHNVQIYGWIPNDKPRYKDFISLFLGAEVDYNGWMWQTSSARYSGKIAKIFECEDIPCQKWTRPKTNQGGK